MKELGITKRELTAKEYWKKMFDEYPNTDSDKLACAMMTEYSNEQTSELLERYNEAIEVLGNVKRLESLIRYPDDISIMHEGEAKAIHMMLNEVEQTISKAEQS